MPEAHEVLNALSASEAATVLASCCGARRWVEAMLRRRPFSSAFSLHAASESAFAELGRDDVLEAFAHHPAIGARPAEILAKAGHSADLARGEQAGVASADQATRDELQRANVAYAQRFGFVFLVCATGKSAREMLDALRARLGNDPDAELGVAAAEQAKITRLRLEKLAT